MTGGAGFVCSAVAESLLACGYVVAIADDLSTGYRDYLPPGATFFSTDITGPALREAFAAFRPDPAGGVRD